MLIGYFWVDLAPDEEHFRQQLDYCCILEERQLLVSATHILLDLLIEKDVAFLSYLVLTAYFLSGLTGAFIRGFLGSDRGPYFVFDFGPPLASFFNVDHLFLVASRQANFCYQFELKGTTSNRSLQTLNLGIPLVLVVRMLKTSSFLCYSERRMYLSKLYSSTSL